MAQKLDLLLVNPGNRSRAYGKLGESLAGIEPPLWCGLMAGFIRGRGYSVKIIDAEAEGWNPEETAAKIAEFNPFLVNVVVMGTNPSASSTPKMTAAGETLSILKRVAPGVKTALSGLHPSSLPERTLREEKVDFVCRGEGFYTILELLEVLKSNRAVSEQEIKGLCYLRDGKMVAGEFPELVKDLDRLPFTTWDLLPMDKYRAHNWHCFQNLDRRDCYAAIYTSLGCPFCCSYCNIRALYNEKAGIRYRSPEKVVEEIGLLVENYRIRNLKIADELFVINEERVTKICDLIIERGYQLNIWAYARVDTVNKTLLRKLKKAGVNWLSFGIESASESVRDGVSKRITQEKIEKAVELTKTAGIYIMGNFIFGLPDDTMETMQETLSLAKRLNCEYVNFYAAMAYPGSKLYQDTVQRGIGLPENWYGYAQLSEEALPLPTKHLSGPEVLRFRDNAFYEYFSDPAYLQMAERKFGPKVVEHIAGMRKHKIKRSYAL